jgi:hypothetical protein
MNDIVQIMYVHVAVFQSRPTLVLTDKMAISNVTHESLVVRPLIFLASVLVSLIFTFEFIGRCSVRVGECSFIFPYGSE